MSVHLVKLCVGVPNLEALLALDRAERALARGYGPDRHMHRTRMRPKRAAEIAGQGSLYWVMSGLIQCRQLIVDLVDVTGDDGTSYCDLVLDAAIVPTRAQPRRPFQGWRYLRPADAPPDLLQHSGLGEGDQSLAEDLARQGLL